IRGLDGGVAQVRHHLAALVRELGLSDDERHRSPSLALLLEHVPGPRAEREHVAGTDRSHVLELLLAVQEASVVELHRASRFPAPRVPPRSRSQCAIVIRNVGGASAPSSARYAGFGSFTARANSRILPVSIRITVAGPHTPSRLRSISAMGLEVDVLGHELAV